MFIFGMAYFIEPQRKFILGILKMYLVLMLNFEAVSTLMKDILGFLVSHDPHNSFDTLLICFHSLVNEWL